MRLVQILLFGVATVTINSAGADQPASLPLPWLTGRWTKPDVWRGALWWSKAEGDAWMRKISAKGDNAMVRLDLAFTDRDGKIAGTLDAVGPDDKKMNVVTFVIARTKDECTLQWNEAGFRYRFTLDGACSPGPRTNASTPSQIRFAHMRGPEQRTPYPIIIEFRMADGKLTLRRVQGPQHGAAIDQSYEFTPTQDAAAAVPSTPTPLTKPGTAK